MQLTRERMDTANWIAVGLWIGGIVLCPVSLFGCHGQGDRILPVVDRCGKPVTPPTVLCRDFLHELAPKRLTISETEVYDICWRDGECFYRCPERP